MTLVELGVNKSADKSPDRPAAAAGQKSNDGTGPVRRFPRRHADDPGEFRRWIATKIKEDAKTLVWSDGDNAYKPADTAKTLNGAKTGTWFIVHVANENVTVRVGARKGSTTGTFVSFKDDRLLILGKNLGESFTKKYGNNVHFNKFRDDVPVYESVDGGEYKPIGTANKVLGNVKEGTVVTVHGEGDDNITLVQIGVPKQELIAFPLEMIALRYEKFAPHSNVTAYGLLLSTVAMFGAGPFAFVSAHAAAADGVAKKERSIRKKSTGLAGSCRSRTAH